MIPQESDAQMADVIAVARLAFRRTWGKTSDVERVHLMNRLPEFLLANADRVGTL